MPTVSDGTISVLLADDDDLIREAVSFLLNSFSELRMVATAHNGLEAVQLTEVHHPDVVLIDMMMPVMDGPTAIRIIKENRPQTKIIALTAVEHPSEVMGGLLNGIDGYLLKRVTKEELRLAIGRVMKGQRYLCPDVAELIFNSYVAERSSQESPLAKITARERDVLELSCAGLKGKAIADHLSISIKTVEKHIANLRAKLHVNTAAEMAMAYTRWKDSNAARSAEHHARRID
jgi:two-component system, NarL family, nitrate/nitrite response regulator NarL